MHTLSVHRVSVSVENLRRLSPAERAMLFLCGHAINEMNSLNKVFAWCLTGESDASEEPVAGQARGMQAMIYARLLAGKVSETWEELKTSWFRSRALTALEPALHSDARDALAALKSYFGPKNTLNRVRNSVAFHYSAAALESDWEVTLAAGDFDLILGGIDGNNFHLGAETLANAALMRSVGPGKPSEALTSFFGDVQSMAARTRTFLEGVSLLLSERALGNAIAASAKPETITARLRVSEVQIPYFCAAEEGA